MLGEERYSQSTLHDKREERCGAVEASENQVSVWTLLS